MSENLFDRKILQMAQRRVSGRSFMHQEVLERIKENLSLLERDFKNILTIESGNFFINGEKKVGDDEFLPFEPQSFDLIISNLNFHFLNQIPQFLLQIKEILKPQGVFIAAFFGEENLHELRRVLYEVENKIYGAISPRVAPTIDVKTAAALLQKAGFVNPLSSVERITIEYQNPLNLLYDLKAMGQGNFLVKRSKKFITKKFLDELKETYVRLYGTNDGKVAASFDVVTIMGIKA